MLGNREGASDRVAVAAEALSVLGTIVLVGWLPFLARQGRWAVTALLGLAVLLGSAGVLIDLLTRRSRHCQAADDTLPEHGDRDRATGAGITSVVVLGDEPTELQRSSVALAARSGPCIVVALDDHHSAAVDDVVSGLDVPVARGADVARALSTALPSIRTGAVLLLSGRAIPNRDACARVAARLDDAHPWAVGRTRPFDPRAGTHDGGAQVQTELRRRTTLHGPALWEPNATIVRTDDLRSRPMTDHRPRGAWLRGLRRRGGRPVLVDDVVAFVASPSSPRTFWPDSFAQQRGAAADAAAAVRESRGTDRLLALLVVARESFAWALPTWLACLLIGTTTGELPIRTAHGAVPVLFGVVLTLRWLGLRRSLGLPLRPVTDLRSMLERIPGSIAALPSTLTARVRPGPRKVSVRPLLWATILTVAVLSTALVDHGPEAAMTVPAVIAALGTLGVLWMLCIQVLAERGWERTTYRLDLSLPARIGPFRGRVINGSPAGIAVAMPTSDDTRWSAGDRVDATVELDDGTTTEVSASVVWVRGTQRGRTLGLSIVEPRHLSATERADAAEALGTWTAQLLRSATCPVDPLAIEAPTAVGRRGRWYERLGDLLGIGLAALLSLVLLAVLGAAMLGIQVAVVRSASMSPTIPQGSVVLSRSVAVSGLRPGDVVTRPRDHDHDAVTHRLVSVRDAGGGNVSVTTLGDANDAAETWDIPADSAIQRVVWTVPAVGEIVSAIRSNLVVALGAALVIGLVVIAVRVPRSATVVVS